MLHSTNVALVGFGMAGQVFHGPLISCTRGLQLHTVVSSDAAKVHAAFPEVRVCADPAAAFADAAIDLVVIATPNATHALLALAALAHGKHVVVDKPFALDVDQARRIVAAAGAAKRIVSVFHNRRWDADFLTLRGLVEGGTLGDVVELHSHFDRYRPVVADRWRERAEPGAGMLLDLGPHLVDQALQLFGPPDSIFADLALQRAAAQVDDYFQLTLRYGSRRVILHAGAMVTASSLRFAVHGTRASFVKHGSDPQEAALKDGQRPGGEDWGMDPRPGQLHTGQGRGLQLEEVGGVAGDYPHFYRAMEAAIRTGSEPPVTPAQAIEVVRLIQLAQDSARLGRALACN